MKQKIRLDTMSDIHQFINVVSRIAERVSLEDDNGHCVSASSLLGALYTMEWNCVYCTCCKDISGEILPWII